MRLRAAPADLDRQANSNSANKDYEGRPSVAARFRQKEHFEGLQSK